MKRKTILLVLFFIILVVLIYYRDTKDEKSRNQILANPRLSTAIVTRFERAHKYGGGTIFYSFNVNSTLFNSSKGYTLANQASVENNIGKTFPIIYDRTNPESNSILITPQDFADYRMSFPDSLEWIKKE